MGIRNLPRWTVAVFIAVSAFATGIAVSAAASSSKPTIFYACLKDGSLSKVSTSQHGCPSKYRAVNWNAQGVQGPPGTSGVSTCDAYPRPNIDLSDCSLSGITLHNLNLSGVNFTGDDLTGADFEGSNLTGANFSNANLTDAVFDGSTFNDAILTGATLTGASFVGVLASGVVNPPSLIAVPVTYDLTSNSSLVTVNVLSPGVGGISQSGYGLTLTNVDDSIGMASIVSEQTFDPSGVVTWHQSGGTYTFTMVAQYTDAFSQESSATITFNVQI